MANNKPTVPTTEDIQYVKFLAAAYGSQIVRRDNKFYDIEHLGTPLSRVDVEMKILNLIAEEHPNLPLNNGIIKSLFKLLIDTRHTDRARSFQVWSGATICEPGNPNRIVMKRGTVSANTWSEPEYRSLKVNSADLDVVGEFFDQFFQHEQDREAFLNWTAWSLQNEGDKPAWAPFLYSRGKGTGKSTTARKAPSMIKQFAPMKFTTEQCRDKSTLNSAASSVLFDTVEDLTLARGFVRRCAECSNQRTEASSVSKSIATTEVYHAVSNTF
ncbi:hypothetical protein K3723_13430 [Leisingera caerulea]|uniref:hypothetical protein n=1 Tax=Leisingera caerulea TaxID=506591 RepID=UPI0021A536CB|nr:hypothetical protein [Leisingera caerulea]UWQ61853.1 hypothetical protein K3723_13430 [Leisingera caerulea]